MFGLAPGVDGAELIVILVVALIVVGPKDLPGLIRRVGKFLGRMRAMAGDFRASFDEMARQSELDDLRREIAEMKNVGPYAMEKLSGSASEAISDIETQIKTPSAASRPFAPAEPVAQGEGEELVEPTVFDPPPLARASRPFSVAEPIATPAAEAAEAPELVTLHEADAPQSGPQPLAAARPFAPAKAATDVEPAHDNTDHEPARRQA